MNMSRELSSGRRMRNVFNFPSNMVSILSYLVCIIYNELLKEN
jgi:hypothetical protein